MAFLFGDLTPAPFSTNFLEELRDAVDFAAALADADQLVVTADARREDLRLLADEDASRIDGIARAITADVEAAEKGANDSSSAAFAAELTKVVAERRDAALANVQRKLDADLRTLETEILAARSDYFPMLERYLLARDPPTASRTLTIALHGTRKDERRYTAAIAGRSQLGLEWEIEVAVPHSGAWAGAMRVEDVAGEIAITAPHLSGLIKKEVKPKKTKLERHFVTRVVDDDATIRVELREELGKPDGFDVTVDLGRRVVMVAKTGEEDDITVGTFEVAPDDQEVLVGFASKVRASTGALAKKRLVDARFDGLPFDGTNTDAQPKLVGLVTRIAERLGPLVDELAVRSRSDEELVLRRVLDDERREELFMPKARLREALEGLDDAHREMFTAIGAALEASAVAVPTTIDVSETPIAPPVRSEVPPAATPYVRRDSNKGMQKVVAPAPKPVLAIEPEIEEPAPPSQRSDLVAMVKQIITVAKGGDVDDAFRQYAALFASPTFGSYRVDDQRQALKLMIHGKTPGTPRTPTEPMKAAHRAALPAVQALVVAHRDPADYELLGMIYVLLDEPDKASEIFRKALEIERSRNPSSDLCGDLMRRVSQL